MGRHLKYIINVYKGIMNVNNYYKIMILIKIFIKNQHMMNNQEKHTQKRKKKSKHHFFTLF